MFIVVHRPAHTLSDIVKLHQEGGGSVYGRIVGTFFQPVRRMAVMIDMWMYVMQDRANIIGGDNFTK